MRRQALPQPFHFPADVLQLLPGSSDLLQRYGRLFGLLFQGFQLLLGLRDLPLQGIVLLLRDSAILQRLIRLFGGFLQCVQLLLSRLDLLLERLILLGQQIRITGVHLEELIDILQL
jgi:hypothetical protein